jgi:universal stress protein A
VKVREEIEKGDYDLSVMPTHGRTGLSRLFLGSVAENVIRLASCSVLVLRDPQ